MKPALLIAALFFTLVSRAQTGDEKAIRQLMTDQVNAWNQGNIDEFMKGYWEDDSLIFVNRSGISYGYATALRNYKKSYPDTAAMGKLTFDLLKLRPLDAGYYFVIGKWHLRRSIGDIGGIFSLVFRRIKGKWFIVADHTS